MTTDNAKTRVAFGRPIGSFQAHKHLLADVSDVVEASQAAVDAAVRALSEHTPSASEVASIAKVFVGESALDAVQDCLQVHGGIGFAWEHDLHLYMRRVASGLAMFGTADEHRARIIRAHRDHGELQ
jgi:alkylation response protein AidB-like acyl-CoA dehydrogenase